MARQLTIARQKVRGAKKHLRVVLAMPSSVDGSFPDPEQHSPRPFWDYKLQIPQSFVEGHWATTKTKRICMVALLQTCAVLRSQKPTDTFAKVVASISVPSMFSSRVTVFFDHDYYRDFFNRSGPYQIWSPLPKNRSLASEWRLPVEPELRLPELGYRETIKSDEDEDLEYTGEIWFYGDIDFQN